LRRWPPPSGEPPSAVRRDGEGSASKHDTGGAGHAGAGGEGGVETENGGVEVLWARLWRDASSSASTVKWTKKQPATEVSTAWPQWIN